MSDADLKANIAVSTDVEQATKKTSNAVVSMQKQLEDVQKKFSTAAKDIFLGFFAPMALFQTALGYITDSINEAKQRAQEGFDLIAKGDTAFASSEQKRYASFVQYKLAQQEEEQKVKEGAQKIYEGFLNTKEGEQIYKKYVSRYSGPEGEANAFTIPAMAASQQVRKDIEDWFKANPDLVAPNKNQKDFKGPEGFSNVVGVGSNPVIEAMNAQLEEAQKQTALLEKIANPEGGVPSDFTKTTK